MFWRGLAGIPAGERRPGRGGDAGDHPLHPRPQPGRVRGLCPGLHGHEPRPHPRLHLDRGGHGPLLCPRGRIGEPGRPLRHPLSMLAGRRSDLRGHGVHRHGPLAAERDQGGIGGRPGLDPRPQPDQAHPGTPAGGRRGARLRHPRYHPDRRGAGHWSHSDRPRLPRRRSHRRIGRHRRYRPSVGAAWGASTRTGRPFRRGPGPRLRRLWRADRRFPGPCGALGDDRPLPAGHLSGRHLGRHLPRRLQSREPQPGRPFHLAGHGQRTGADHGPGARRHGRLENQTPASRPL